MRSSFSGLLLEGVAVVEVATEGKESLVKRGPALVALDEAARAVEPVRGALDQPAVPAGPLTPSIPFQAVRSRMR